MAYSSVKILCLVILSVGRVAESCDAQGMSKCNTDYLAAAPAATGTKFCDAVSNLATCMNSKGASCPAAVLAPFNTIVSKVKDPACKATGTCANHTLCTGGSSLESSSASSARSVSMSWLLLALVACTLFFFGEACDAQGMSQCNTDYMAAAPAATGTKFCDAVSNLATCMNNKGASCPAAVLAPFNTIVSKVKDPACKATGTCANHTLCTGTSSAGSGSSSASFAWTAPVSLLTVACMYLGVAQ